MKAPVPLRGEAPASALALVVAAYRRHYTVRASDGELLRCVIRGRELPLACGDRVHLSHIDGHEGVIEDVAPRESLFFRSDAHRQKLIAANVTQVLAIVAPDPPYDEELVHRWIVAADASECRFVLVANKSDLPEFSALQRRLAHYVELGYPVVALSAREGAKGLRTWVTGQRSVLIGQSGMGKSTLVNALAPGAQARVGEVSASLKTGRHTTSETQLYALDDASWIVDSPGMKAFGLAHLSPAAIERAFVDMQPWLGACRFRDCAHDKEPGCALQDALRRGAIRPWRLELFRSLLTESHRR